MWTALVVKVSRVSLPCSLFRHSDGSVNYHRVASATDWHAVWRGYIPCSAASLLRLCVFESMSLCTFAELGVFRSKSFRVHKKRGRPIRSSPLE